MTWFLHSHQRPRAGRFTGLDLEAMRLHVVGWARLTS
jgi:hypothetical protein